MQEVVSALVLYFKHRRWSTYTHAAKSGGSVFNANYKHNSFLSSKLLNHNDFYKRLINTLSTENFFNRVINHTGLKNM